ncbi:MAG: ATP-binding protein, partial [Candidatus Thermoplasmatota archaeon]
MAERLSEPDELDSIDAWIQRVEIRSTAELKIPDKLVDQVIGQESAVEVIKKASEQRRHVLLIGDPGTGKSMLARSMTELLPRDELQDIIVYHNPDDPNEPRIRVVPASKGREIVNAQKAEAMQRREQKASMMMTILFFIVGLSVLLSLDWTKSPPVFQPMVLLFGILVAGIIW